MQLVEPALDIQPLHLLAQLAQLFLLHAAFSFRQADLLSQPLDQLLLQADRFLLQAGLLSQQPIFFLKLDQFFFCHALTLPGVAKISNFLGDLSSYEVFLPV